MFTNINLAKVLCVMLARGKLEFIKLSPRTCAEVKCMVRMTYVAIRRRGSFWGASPPKRCYGNPNFSPSTPT